MAKLIAQSGHSLDLPRHRVTLGESPTCDIPLAAGLGLAPRHFEIEPNASGGYVVRDVSNGPGVLVNGLTVKEKLLEHGSVICAGSLRLGFWNETQESAPALPATPRPVTEEALTRPSMASAKPAAVPALPASPPPLAVAPVEQRAQSAPPPVSGPPVAWVNPADEIKAAATPTLVPPAEASTATGRPISPRQVPLMSRIPGRVRRAGRRVATLAILGSLGAGGYFASRLPAVQAWTTPLLAKFKDWTNPSPAAPATTPSASATPAAPAKGSNASPQAATAVAREDDNITPKTEHSDVVKRLLSERTTSLFTADLRQLVPYYNSKAAERNLPPQSEMAAAFQKHYGLLLDGFDRVTCLRAEGKDEFVFILTGSTQINIETVLGIPPRNAHDNSAPAASGKKPSFRIYPVKPTGRLYGVAQYDPFTVILGRQTWIETALNSSEGTALREAACMFPDTAARNPGALIMVERLAGPEGSAPPLPFQTAVSNLFFEGKGESRLTLTRNPDVKEEAFVQRSSEALKEQFKALHQSVKLNDILSAKTKKDGHKGEASPPDSGELITTTEASIIIPDGEALLREAIDSVAHTFMNQSPSVELILSAQKAVLAFNQARLQRAPETQNVTSVAEILELLQNGISVSSTPGQRDTTCQIERLEPSQADEIVHLLSIEEGSRLVFRPNPDRISGTLLDLATKARDYRNAELLISLWNAAKLTAADAGDTQSAARKVLDWANGPGARQRLSVGLPTLTPDEYKQALALLSIQNGQLTWRPGEEGYRTWLRKVNPDPKADAKRIAGIFQEAQRAGAIPNGKVTEIAEAVKLLNTGVRAGSGSTATLFSATGYTTDELRAAARYMRFESGAIKVLER